MTFLGVDRSVVGYCPACNHETLFMGEGGHVTCSLAECSAPTLVNDLLSKPDQHVHLVDFREDGYTVQHPLAERVRVERLSACELTEQFRALEAPPGVGLFLVPVGGSLADAYEVDRGSVLFEGPAVSPSPEVQAQPDVSDLIPIGSVTAQSTSAPLADNCIEAQREVRLPAADYPDLAESVRAAGFETMEIDGVAHIAIDMPEEAIKPPEGIRYVLRVK